MGQFTMSKWRIERSLLHLTFTNSLKRQRPFSIHFQSPNSSDYFCKPISTYFLRHHYSTNNGGREKKETTLGDIPSRLKIIYTCNVCQTRSSKEFSKQSYMEGVVLVRCPGCKRLHLIADNLGWFADKKT